jgi:hypothetical protein
MMRMVVALLVLAACDSPGTSRPPPIVDAILIADSLDCFVPESRSVACDLVSQVGCMPAQRCALVRLPKSGNAPVASCIDEGSVAEGGACVWMELDNAPGCPIVEFDNCLGGGACTEGSCREICVIGNETCAIGTCVHDPVLFPMYPDFGVCRE